MSTLSMSSSCSIGSTDIQSDANLELHRDQLLLMRKLESTVYRRTSELVDEAWREPIMEWMYAVVGFCNLSHAAVAAASSYLDTAVMKGLLVSAQDYQLGAMAALFLACKCYDSPFSREFELSSFLVRLGNGQFNEDQVIDMEKKLIETLEWKLHPPTPNCFLDQYMLLLPKDTSCSTRRIIRDVSMWILHIAVCREQFIETRPSILALAAMFVAIERIDPLDFSRCQLHTFVFNVSYVAKLDYKSAIVTRAVDKLHRTMSRIPDPTSNAALDGYFQNQNSKRGNSCNSSVSSMDEDYAPIKTTSTTSPNYVAFAQSTSSAETIDHYDPCRYR